MTPTLSLSPQLATLLDSWERFGQFLARPDALQQLSTEDVIAELINRSLLEEELGRQPDVSSGVLTRLHAADVALRAAAPAIVDGTDVSLFHDDEPPTHWWWRLNELVLGESAAELLSVPEAARLKEVHPHTLRAAIKAGLLPARRLARGFLVSRRDLERWQPRSVGRPRRRTIASSEASDVLLEAFNAANTAEDFEAAHKVANVISRDLSSPRRRLALAIDLFNRHEYRNALDHAETALRTGLSGSGRATGLLVRGMALLALGRSREAVECLEQVGDPTEQLRVHRLAALAEALSEIGRPAQAWRAASKAVVAAPTSSQVRYVAARVAWHSNRVWDALEQVLAYRVLEPTEPEGLMLHGSILGLLGDQRADPALYRRAADLFHLAHDSGDCRALRGHALAAARLGRWREAVREARTLAAQPGQDGHSQVQHVQWARDLANSAVAALITLGKPTEASLAATEAARWVGATPELVGLHGTALAVEGRTDELLALFEADLQLFASLPTERQGLVAFCLVRSHRGPEALPILRSLVDAQPSEEIELMLAQSAMQSNDPGTARDALDRLAARDRPSASVARVALAILRASGEERRDYAISSVVPNWIAQLKVGSDPIWRDRVAADTAWEGDHRPMSRVLERARLGLLH